MWFSRKVIFSTTFPPFTLFAYFKSDTEKMKRSLAVEHGPKKPGSTHKYSLACEGNSNPYPFTASNALYKPHLHNDNCPGWRPAIHHRSLPGKLPYPCLFQTASYQWWSDGRLPVDLAGHHDQLHPCPVSIPAGLGHGVVVYRLSDQWLQDPHLPTLMLPSLSSIPRTFAPPGCPSKDFLPSAMYCNRVGQPGQHCGQLH